MEGRKDAKCDICGACGFHETIVSCSKCNNREHAYCMRHNTLVIPKVWICESCKSQDVSTSAPRKVNQGIGLMDSKMQHVKTRSVKFLPENEVIRLLSSNFPVPITRKTSVESKNVISKNPSLTPKSHPCISPPKVLGKHPRNNEVHKKLSLTPKSHLCISPPTILGKHPRNDEVHKKLLTNRRGSCSLSKGPSNECIGENQKPLGRVIPDKKVQTLDPQKEKPRKGAPFEALSAGKSFPIVGSGAILCADAECNRSNIEKGDLHSFQEYFKLRCKFLPCSIPTWRGQIQIIQTGASSEIYDGFEAQPPCVVNKKAYNFSKQMPSVLQLESLPLLNVLTEVFTDDSPNLEDIALYFIPLEHSERFKMNLNSILKFMDAKKSVLRSCIDGVELLLFTSNQLGMDSKDVIAEVKVEPFLWGIFVKRVPNMEPIDMEIDMIGGKDVTGRVDHAQKDRPKGASLIEYYNDLDVPPGFEDFAKKKN